ncbi:MAG: MarR family transcriptional regulator [Clostridia bacterium]|nr:MarR family transcriptional regulator [Clostridia bacterium]
MKAFSQFRKIHWRPGHVRELSPSEFLVLHTIKKAASENSTGLMVSQISVLLGIAPPTVTQLVKSLAKKGYLEKSADRNDKRAVRIKLSEKGLELGQAASSEFYSTFMGLSEYLGEEKSELLAELLHEVFSYFDSIKFDN